MQTEAARLIDELGGTTAVARELGVPVTTVHSWRKSGIPHWRQQAVDSIARAKGGAPTPEDIIASPTPKQRGAA